MNKTGARFLPDYEGGATNVKPMFLSQGHVIPCAEDGRLMNALNLASDMFIPCIKVWHQNPVHASIIKKVMPAPFYSRNFLCIITSVYRSGCTPASNSFGYIVYNADMSIC